MGRYLTLVILGLLGVSLAATAGEYSLELNQEIDYSELPEDDKMLGFTWSKFAIPATETVKRVDVYISTEKNYIGKWQGAFGSSTQVAPSYWTMTDDMAEAFTSKTGVVSWELEEATGKIIQMKYGGELKWGVWWIDCGVFTIDKIVVYTSAYKGDLPSGGDVKATEIEKGVYQAKLGTKYVLSELGTDKMLPIPWTYFTIPSSKTITKISVTISTTEKKLGKWQGAFGSSTGVEPDYWYMTDDMAKTLTGTEDTIDWEIDSEISELIQTQTDGLIKFGVWWIDAKTFTLESCTVYTK